MNRAGLVALLMLAAACTDDAGVSSSAGDERGSGWQQLADAPLSPREDAMVERLGDKVVVIGGREYQDCGDQRSCMAGVSLRDGAAFDLETQTWSPIAQAPRVAVGGWMRAVSGDRLYVVTGFPGRVREYDASEDDWTAYPTPPHVYRGADTWAATRKFVFVTRAKDGPGVGIDRLNLRTRTWTTLPASPQRPRLDLRTLFPTPDGLVVTGAEVASSHYRPRIEVLRDGTWTRATNPPPDVRGWHWYRSGNRLLAPLGENGHPGMSYDLTTSTWEALPEPPSTPGWSINWATAGDLYSSDGTTFDASTNHWVTFPAPSPGDVEGMGAWVGRALLAVDHNSHSWWLEDGLTPAHDPS